MVAFLRRAKIKRERNMKPYNETPPEMTEMGKSHGK
jgi:hypothetical protein